MTCLDCRPFRIITDSSRNIVGGEGVELCARHAMLERLVEYLRQFHEWHARDYKDSVIGNEAKKVLKEYDQLEGK